jgi:hypothetical protein
MTSVTASSLAAMSQPSYIMGIDQVLVGKPTSSFFKHEFKQYANFSMELLGHQLSNVRAGATGCVATVSGVSDMCYELFVNIRLPAIMGTKDTSNTQRFPCASDSKTRAADKRILRAMSVDGTLADGMDRFMAKSAGAGPLRDDRGYETETAVEDDAMTVATRNPGRQKYWAHYVNAVGFVAIREVTIVIGHTAVDSINSDFLFIWDELATQPGHRMGVNEMVGKAYSREQLILDSQKERDLWVPIPFWHTSTPAKALATCAFHWSPVEYHVSFATWEEMIVRANPDTKVTKLNGTELSDGDFQACLQMTHMYIDPAERDRMADEPFDVLITQHHRQKHFTNFSELSVKFPHPTIALCWFIRRKVAEQDNDWFNWTGVCGSKPWKTASLKFNTATRQQAKSHMYFRNVQGRSHFPCIPDAEVGLYSFAFDATDPDPCGACTLTRYETVTLGLELQDALNSEQITAHVHQLNWQILRHEDGVVLPAFAG